MKTNKLHINLSKCAHMYFRPNLHYKEHLSCARTTGYDQGLTLSVMSMSNYISQISITITIEFNNLIYSIRQKVKKSDKVKFLGVIIDENLTWDDQIKHL